MTAPRIAVPRPVPQPQPAARPAPRPLRVVPDPAVLRTKRLVRLFTALAGLVAFFGLFGVVVLHVMLAQGQGDVQRLRDQVQEQEDAHQRLRLQVAELESPERIVAAARQQLGMTTPSTVVLLPGTTLANR